jgi:hypothetical protein
MPKILFRMLLGAAIASAAYTPPLENQGRVPDATEAGAILKAVCGDGAQVKDSSQGARMYCNPCPDFTSLHGITTEQFELRWVLSGSFTAPNSQDLAVFFRGCELLTDHFGGVVLLNKAADGWKMARYDSALLPLAVRAVRLGAGRDVLFAEGNLIGLGLDTNTLYTFDFTQQPGTARQNILTVSDTRRACGYNITKASLDKLTWEAQDFTATVTWGRIKAGKDYLRDCPDKIPDVATQTYQLHFKFDGATFQPADDSKSIYDQISNDQTAK